MDCPNAASGAEGGSRGRKICYKCGSTEHSLRNCPKLTPEEKKMAKQNRMDYQNMVLPFATCFICKQTGHLSGQCKENKNGLYIKGGCCKLCGSKAHLVMYCPKAKTNKVSDDEKEDEQSAGDVEEFLEEDYSNKEIKEEKAQKSEPVKKKKKVVNF
jgi:hypothetical protein